MEQSRPVAEAQGRAAAQDRATHRQHVRDGKLRTRGSGRSAPRGGRTARRGRVPGAHFPRRLRERAAPSTIRADPGREADPGRTGASMRARPAETSAVPGRARASGRTDSVVAKTEANGSGAAARGRVVRSAGLRIHRGPLVGESRSDPANRFRLSPSPPRVPPPGVRLRIGRGREGHAAMRNGRSARQAVRRIGAVGLCRRRNGNPPAARGVPTRRRPGRETGPRKVRRRQAQRKPNAPARRIAPPARRWTASSPARASAPAPWPRSGFAKGAFV